MSDEMTPIEHARAKITEAFNAVNAVPHEDPEEWLASSQLFLAEARKALDAHEARGESLPEVIYYVRVRGTVHSDNFFLPDPETGAPSKECQSFYQAWVRATQGHPEMFKIHGEANYVPPELRAVMHVMVSEGPQGREPECHLPRWVDPDTGKCEHPSHDFMGDEEPVRRAEDEPGLRLLRSMNGWELERFPWGWQASYEGIPIVGFDNGDDEDQPPYVLVWDGNGEVIFKTVPDKGQHFIVHNGGMQEL